MDPKSYQLHHYTPEFSKLKRILQKDGGFWPCYSLEDFSWTQKRGTLHYLAFPCTCFCDLPFEVNAMHRADYGGYVISFDKSSELAKSLTPLIYVNEDGPLAKMIRAKHGHHLSRFEETETTPDNVVHCRPTVLVRDKLRGLWEFLPYLKSSLGHTLQRRPPPKNGGEHDYMPKYDYLWTTKYLEEEFEWRYVPPKHRDALYCFEDYDRWSIGKLDELSQATNDSFLKFSQAEVAAVVVVTDAERTELVGIHPDFAGKVKTWNELPNAASNED
jgi:Putative abortive phage resistance protein AbiGi, antitoxin